MDWFQIGEYIKAVCRVHHGNPGLNEAQAGIKIASRNTNNLRCADAKVYR